MRIIVNEQKTKDQLIKESEYIHINGWVDGEKCPNLMCLCLAPDIIEVNDIKVDYDRLLELRDELKVYAEWEGSELGEMTNALIYLSQYPDYMTEDLLKVLYREMEYTLMMFKRDTEWIEEEETITRKVKTLEWKH